MTAKQIKCLVAVGETTHTTHDSEDVVIDSEHKSVSGDSSACDKLSVVDSGEVACSRWLVFFWF